MDTGRGNCLLQEKRKKEKTKRGTPAGKRAGIAGAFYVDRHASSSLSLVFPPYLKTSPIPEIRPASGLMLCTTHHYTLSVLVEYVLPTSGGSNFRR